MLLPGGNNIIMVAEEEGGKTIVQDRFSKGETTTTTTISIAGDRNKVEAVVHSEIGRKWPSLRHDFLVIDQ
jgi:hypothetical protein